MTGIQLMLAGVAVAYVAIIVLEALCLSSSLSSTEGCTLTTEHPSVRRILWAMFAGYATFLVGLLMEVLK